MVFFNLDFFQF